VTETHAPTTAGFTDGWVTDYSGEHDGAAAGGVSRVSSSIDVTAAAAEVWPAVALAYGIPPEDTPETEISGQSAPVGDYDLAAVFPVMLPTPGSFEARPGDAFLASLTPSDAYVVLMHDEHEGDVRAFGMARRHGVWQYAIGQPEGLDELPFMYRRLAAEQVEQLVLVCGQEQTCWAVYPEEPRAVRASLLYVPHYTEMFIDDQRIPVGIPMDWDAVLQPFELRY
jgi:hypothetical protein